jgi:hypothetical protein
MHLKPQLKSRRAIINAFLVSVFFGMLAVYNTRPIYKNLNNSTVYMPGDGILTAYFMRWDLHQLFRAPLRVFDAPFYYPLNNTLALSENLIGLALLMAPLNLFKDTLLLANAVILFSFWSLALVAYWVFRHWTGSRWLGIIAGIYIGFAAPRYSQTGHLQLLSYQPMLLSVFFIERWIGRYRWRDALLFWASLLAQFLFGIYLFEFNLIILAVIVPILLLARHRSIPWRVFPVQLCAGALVSGSLMWPVYVRYARMRASLSGGNTLEQLRDSGASLTDYLHVSSFNETWWQWGQRWVNTYSPFPWEHEMGMVYSMWPLLLLGLGFAFAHALRRNKRIEHRKGLYIALGAACLLCFVLSFGPVLHLSQQPLKFPLPFKFFFEHFPGFNGMRVPSRFFFTISVLLNGFAHKPL